MSREYMPTYQVFEIYRIMKAANIEFSDIAPGVERTEREVRNWFAFDKNGKLKKIHCLLKTPSS